MTIFGKILIVFNILAATGFVYLAAIDWAKRYSWSYADYRDDLMLRGLPVDDNERDPIQEYVLVDKLSDNTAKHIFQSFGEPVKTQTQEVERVRDLLKAAVDGAGNDAAKRQKLLSLLLPLANTSGERYELQERFADKAVSLETLQAEFGALFEEALLPEIKEDEPARAADLKREGFAGMLPRDKRRAIAHLLFNLHAQADKESVDADHARLQVVIGLLAFNEESRHMASALNAMAEQTNFAILGDQAGFEVDHKAMLDEVRSRVEVLADRQLDLEKQQKLKEDHQKLADSRKKDVEDAKEKLGAARKVTFEALQKQATEEEVLFKAQRFLGNAKAENERLERSIRVLEKVKR